MPRVNSVKKARKPQGKCGKCGTELKVGEPYKFIKFRHAGIRKRCDKSKCRFRPSDLTNSKMSQVYAVQESVEDQLAAADHDTVTAEELREMIGEVAESVEEIAEEYRESAENQRQYFPESPTADESEEKAEELDGWHSTLEGNQGDIEEFDEDGARSEAEQELRQEAEENLKDGQELDEGWEADGGDVDNKISESRNTWAEEQIAKVEEYINDCPL